MTTQWTIAIDWNRDGDYADTYDNVTDRVISANWFLGMRQPFQDAADNALCALILDNSDRRFSPEYASSPLYGSLVPFRPVRIQSDDGTTVRTHFVGWLESIQPAVNKNGERTISILVTDAMQFLGFACSHWRPLPHQVDQQNHQYQLCHRFNCLFKGHFPSLARCFCRKDPDFSGGICLFNFFR